MFNVTEYMALREKHIVSQTKEDLDAVRIYLDTHGMEMPKPKYTYDEEDKTTWRFLEGKIIKGNQYKDILNPEFKYSRI